MLAGAALIVASIALKIHVLRSAYFIEDDFLFFGDAAATDLTLAYLTDLHKGHLMPGAKLLAYILAGVAPYNWAAASGIMIVLQAGATTAVFALLWELLGRRWALIAPLAVYAAAPLTIPVLAWWSAALNAVPFQLAIALSLLWTVRYLRTGEDRYGWLAAGAVLLGMAFSVKAVFLPVLLLAVAVLFLVPGRLPGVLWRTVDRDLPFWVGMGALSVGYGLLYLSRQETAGGEGAGLPELGVAGGMLRRMLGETFPVGAVGGPGEWTPVTASGGLLNPPAAAVAAAWAGLLLIVLASLLVRRRSWRAWALLVGYLLLVDAVPTIVARGRYEPMVGFDPRYVADAALVFALCLALAYLPVRNEEDTERRRRPPLRAARAAAVTATAAMTAAGAFSTYAFADTLHGDRVRWYLDTVRRSVSEVPAEAGIYPRPVPQDIVLPWNGPRRLTSHLLSPLADPGVEERIRNPEPAGSALVFNDAGFLVPAEPVEGSAFFGPPEDEECAATVEGQVRWPVEAMGGPTQVLTVAYNSEEETELGAVLGDAWVTTRMPAAPDGGMWYLPVDGAGAEVTVHTNADELCMEWVTFGELQPITDGDPWQQEQGDDGDGDEGDDGG
ncbi:membrane protein [Streptomonospora alba]|uniref:Membrane protein n=1 Tax=Streptomonospora alba TaxID=183763 RepID=A0A0C2JD67_9ACTN|nr:membrane protein [Streptomonospora alba]